MPYHRGLVKENRREKLTKIQVARSHAVQDIQGGLSGLCPNQEGGGTGSRCDGCDGVLNAVFDEVVHGFGTFQDKIAPHRPFHVDERVITKSHARGGF